MSTIKSSKITMDGRKFKVNVEFYNSTQEVVEDCKTRTNTDSRFHDYNVEDVRKSWHGCDSYDEALELLKNGYQPTVEKFKESIKVNRTGEKKRITFQNETAGFAPIVPLALKGVPNCMINMTMKPIKCKVIDVYYDMTVSAGVDPDQIIKNGQELLKVIMDLEKQGYRFNLYAIQGYSDETSADVLCVKVKSSDKPIDLKRISVPITHPSFFRVIGFDWYGKCPVATYRSGYGRGIAYELKNEEMRRSFGKQVFGDNAVYMSAGYLGGESSIKEALTSNENKGKN